MTKINPALLRAIAPVCGAFADIYATPLEQARQEFGIDDGGRELAAFLAQLAIESDSFRKVSESLNYKSAERLKLIYPSSFKTLADAAMYAGQPKRIGNRVYANRLGNGDEASGDGYRYHGRGLIQITGKNNYKACSADLFGFEQILLDDPDRLLQSVDAARSAAWYWWKNRCGPPAVRGEFSAVTRIINGSGMAGQEERIAAYNRAKRALGM